MGLIGVTIFVADDVSRHREHVIEGVTGLRATWISWGSENPSPNTVGLGAIISFSPGGICCCGGKFV